MKKTIFSIITVLILFLLQTSVFNHISLGGVVPNLMLLVICIYGFMRGETAGLITGFFCGLINDVFFMSNIGYFTFLYMYLGYFNGKLHEYYYSDDYVIPVTSFVFTDFVASLANYVFLFLLRGRFNFTYYLLNIILAELVYTLGTGILLYPLLRIIETKIINKKIIKEPEDVL